MMCGFINKYADKLFTGSLDAADKKILHDHLKACSECSEKYERFLEHEKLINEASLTEEAPFPIAASILEHVDKKRYERHGTYLILKYAAAVMLLIAIFTSAYLLCPPGTLNNILASTKEKIQQGFEVIGRKPESDRDINQTLINAVSEMEKSTFDLNTLKISYADYKKSTDKYLSKHLTSFYIQGNIIYTNEDLVKAITGKDYTEKDWLSMSFEEIKKIGEPLSKSIAINAISHNYKSCGISKVYDDTKSDSSLQMKSIFVRRDVQWHDGTDFPLYWKYTFIKDGKSYGLLSFENVYLPKGKELTRGDEKVDFIQNINLQ